MQLGLVPRLVVLDGAHDAEHNDEVVAYRELELYLGVAHALPAHADERPVLRDVLDEAFVAGALLDGIVVDIAFPEEIQPAFNRADGADGTPLLRPEKLVRVAYPERRDAVPECRPEDDGIENVGGVPLPPEIDAYLPVDPLLAGNDDGAVLRGRPYYDVRLVADNLRLEDAVPRKYEADFLPGVEVFRRVQPPFVLVLEAYPGAVCVELLEELLVRAGRHGPRLLALGNEARYGVIDEVVGIEQRLRLLDAGAFGKPPEGTNLGEAEPLVAPRRKKPNLVAEDDDEPDRDDDKKQEQDELEHFDSTL